MNNINNKYFAVLTRMFIRSGEYTFQTEELAQKFINELLVEAERAYSDEGYYHKYEEFQEFLYTHHVDGMAFWLYEDKYAQMAS